jgi:hypothetical protein
MFELFRSGEILPDGRTNEDEKTLIAAGTGANGEHRGPTRTGQQNGNHGWRRMETDKKSQAPGEHEAPNFNPRIARMKH